jgi:hypothetical protein
VVDADVVDVDGVARQNSVDSVDADEGRRERSPRGQQCGAVEGKFVEYERRAPDAR